MTHTAPLQRGSRLNQQHSTAGSPRREAVACRRQDALWVLGQVLHDVLRSGCASGAANTSIGHTGEARGKSTARWVLPGRGVVACLHAGHIHWKALVELTALPQSAGECPPVHCSTQGGRRDHLLACRQAGKLSC